MELKNIYLNEIKNLQKFVFITNLFEPMIDVISKDGSAINGKSLLGMMTLDLSEPIKVRFCTKDEKEITRFTNKMKEFMEDN